jgi:hypothetical protein
MTATVASQREDMTAPGLLLALSSSEAARMRRSSSTTRLLVRARAELERLGG